MLFKETHIGLHETKQKKHVYKFVIVLLGAKNLRTNVIWQSQIYDPEF